MVDTYKNMMERLVMVMLMVTLLMFQIVRGEGEGSCTSQQDKKLLFTSLNHVSRECRDPELVAEFYISLLGFKRIPAPQFHFKTIWLEHPSGLIMHLIDGTPDFRLAEGSSRNAETGERSPQPFVQGSLDPIHVRRGHHLAFNISDLDAFKAELAERGIPYGQAQVPGSSLIQLFWFDVEGNGLEALYDTATSSSSSSSSAAATP